MDRNTFLNQHWKSYPAMPADCKAAGRIYRLEREEGGLEISLIRDNQEQIITFDKAPPQSEFLIEGDIVAIISATEIVLLAPNKSSLPTRTYDKDILEKWNRYVEEVRHFFRRKGFLEVKTPSLVVCPGTEPALDVFATELKVGSRTEKLYLPTSPELHLKKALALGAEKIFEIAPCFRNGEVTERHQPEFSMLEWYRAYDNLATIKQDVIDLVQHLVKVLKFEPPRRILSYSVAELFKIHCGFDFTPETTKQELKELAQKLGVDVHSAESIDDYFFLIFMDKIESQLHGEDLIFVEKYPPYQAALARLTKDGWGDRFEAYWKGLELCNAFHELNDPQIQRQRSEVDLQKKQESQKEVISLDQEFFQCLDAGLPPSGGIALGVERLFMALHGIRKISDISVFPK
ncbi:EF-P lysine aminoacylase EpmA [Bdellovibrio sp. SKB1291214]|uniref:EF-P lysine aminoacylase EpmA n=1 Tax=Bdellovibrio sp. SKB1291214 TaxID=1732569 RepID=UPI0020CC80D0|nr:EF-P lysine aminoacylase EpmA [Bdellovibrio sp. SKB1291214]UYL09079.1 EF-P lysine aminoacylase EpmA [Bdellovibrio sp. SKB1291214]